MKPRDNYIQVRVDKKMKGLIRREAERRGLTVSGLVMSALSIYPDIREGEK